MNSPMIPYINSAAMSSAISWSGAIEAIEHALRGGLDPSKTHDRSIIDVRSGQILLMPAESATAVGVKVATVAPDNPAISMPRIQALYVLLDPNTLTPVALMDGATLTTLRTPAVSAVAVSRLAPHAANNLVVMGTGPQAWGHVQALRCIRPLQSVTLVGRDRDRGEALANKVRDSGMAARFSTSPRLEEADILVCATTAGTPLFDSTRLKPDACVVAVGSHDASRREVDSGFVAKAASHGNAIVETLPVALREAGDIVMGISEGALTSDQLSDIAAIVKRDSPRPGPSLFKSVGMGWQDLVVAQAIYESDRA